MIEIKIENLLFIVLFALMLISAVHALIIKPAPKISINIDNESLIAACEMIYYDD
jgi:hypothetical protein